ncbi:MAG: nicotinate-nucleotide adenylyltransferase [Desulfobacterota bacterium]|nr:nicotinate-nucleotide adenylyltransferase [Thermodesulfobacteriota bacterium]
MKKPEFGENINQRVGLFGGTFNPIHFGHLRAAEEIREFFNLDQVIFIPSGIPPHKISENIVPPRHRFNMVKLAIQDNPGFWVSDFEIKSPTISYSIITIKHFRENLGENTALFFLLGIDAFLEINTWKDLHQLFYLIDFIVMSRPGYNQKLNANLSLIDENKKFLYNAKSNCYIHTSGHKLFFQEITLLDFSSRIIRQRIRNEQSIRYLVPSTVEEYIKKNELYQE